MSSVVGLLALAGLLLALGSAQGWGLLHTLAYSLLLMIALSYAWSWISVRGLYIRGRPKLLRSQVGAHLEERAELENLSWFPKPWLEVIDAADHPEHNLSQVVSLGPLSRRIRVVRTLCRQRGQFTLGPIWAAGGDPFGLFRRERQILPASSLIVLPATVELPAYQQLPGELPGGSLQGERVHFTTPNVATLRDYEPGDSFNRVHWRSTARLGRLMVKEFERDPFSDIWLVLDLDRLVQVGSGSESTDECAVTITASLARHFLLQDRAVGIVTQGHMLPLDRGPRQLMRSLEFLAVARASRGQSLDELLLAEEHRFGRRDNAVIVTPATGGHWVSMSRDLAARGVRSSVVLVDASSFGPAPSSARVLGALGASSIPTYMVRHGVNIAASLTRPALGGSVNRVP